MDSYVFQLLVTVPVSNFNGGIKCNNFPRVFAHRCGDGVVLKFLLFTGHVQTVSVCHDTFSDFFSSQQSAQHQQFLPLFGASAVTSPCWVRRFLPLLGASVACWCDAEQ